MIRKMIKKRIWEIDFIRAMAIILMVIFHIVYDLNEFFGANVDYNSEFWFFIGKFSAFLFIFVSGISSVISSDPIKRGIQTFLIGMVITAITFIFFRDEYIRFGILHFLGISMILTPYLRRINNYILIIISIISVVLGLWFNEVTVDTFVFIPFGVMYSGFSTLDYYPIFPYISLFILGIIFSKKFYSSKKSLFKKEMKIGFVGVISTNSLLIYLLHQPVILIILFLLNNIIRMLKG